MKFSLIFTIWMIALTGYNASVGFKKQSAQSLLKKPKERMLADSQQMLDAQDSRNIIYIQIQDLTNREN